MNDNITLPRDRMRKGAEDEKADREREGEKFVKRNHLFSDPCVLCKREGKKVE